MKTSETLPPVPPTPPGGAKSRRSGLFIGALVCALLVGGGVAVALVLNHRADLAAEERRDKAAAEKAEQEAKAAAEAEEEARELAEREAAELAARKAEYDSCRSEVDPFLNRLMDVDARLDVGLNQGELSDMVGDASIAYNRMNIQTLGTGDCLSAAARLESAFNNYAATVNQWNDCIYEDDYCELDDIDADLQKKWASASKQIDQAERLIEKLNPA